MRSKGYPAIVWFLVFIIALFSVWLVSDVILGNTDVLADRILIIIIGLSLLFMHRQLRLNMPVLLFGMVPVLLHSLGWYSIVFLGIPYDHYIHFFAGAAITIVLYRALAKDDHSGILLAVCVTAGLGSFMEIIEFLGYKYGGAGSGILFYGAGDYGEWNNAVWDMLMNTVGALVGAVFLYLKKRLYG